MSSICFLVFTMTFCSLCTKFPPSMLSLFAKFHQKFVQSAKFNCSGIQTVLLFISSIYMYMCETKLREIQSLSISFMVKSY